MAYSSGFFAKKCIYLALLFAVCAAEECDKKKCPGPLQYYEDLGCTPVYKNPGDCCAEAYNCDNLKNLKKDKCYVNDHEYSIGEKLKEEDANPCDKGCLCSEGHNNIAGFTCAIVDCFFGPPKPNCYRKKAPGDCCPGQEVCLADGADRPTCEVDGVIYREGDYFSPKSDPDLNCNCMPGYTGENVEPFCKKPNRPYCAPLFKNADNIHQHCAPVYYSNQSPQTDCNLSTRCQNKNDTVIHNHGSRSSDDSAQNTCKFGDLVMHTGDELNQNTDYNSVCVKCVCDVPPIPTCQRLPDEECDVTNHPQFD